MAIHKLILIWLRPEEPNGKRFILLTAATLVPFLQPGSPCSHPIFEHHFSFRLRHALTFAAAIMMGVWGKAAS